MNERLDEGKIDHSLLKELVGMIGHQHQSVIQLPSPGIDIATIDLKKTIKEINDYYGTSSTPYLIYKSDPITFPTQNPGYYLITVNRNDLATAGAIPFAITVTLLLPPGFTKEELFKVQKELDIETKKSKIAILGGHTEVTTAVNNIVLSGSMIGFVPPEYYIPRNPHQDDVIICSGWIGAEGTGILISEGKDKLTSWLTSSEIKFGEKIGAEIDISPRILECNKELHQGIYMVHDATEGGILAAIYECLEPLGLGATINRDQLPLAKPTEIIANQLSIDPLRLISSGCVLLFCDKEFKDEIIGNLTKSGFPAAEIGVVTKTTEITMNGKTIDPPKADELIKALKKLSML